MVSTRNDFSSSLKCPQLLPFFLSFFQFSKIFLCRTTMKTITQKRCMGSGHSYDELRKDTLIWRHGTKCEYSLFDFKLYLFLEKKYVSIFLLKYFWPPSFLFSLITCQWVLRLFLSHLLHWPWWLYRMNMPRWDYLIRRSGTNHSLGKNALRVTYLTSTVGPSVGPKRNKWLMISTVWITTTGDLLNEFCACRPVPSTWK